MYEHGIMNQYDLTVEIKVNVGHCELYGTSFSLYMYIENFRNLEKTTGPISI